MPCTTPLLLQVLLRGGLPDPVVRVNVSCALDLSESAACPSDKVIGFDGFRILPSGHVVRGVAELDSLVLKSSDFLSLSDEIKSHVASEASRLAARPKRTCAAERRDNVSAECDATIRGPDDPHKIHYNPSVDDYGCFVTKQGENNWCVQRDRR